MRILFNLMTTIEVPDADVFPPREDVEKQLIEFFAEDGMIAHGLKVTNYAVPAEEEGEKE